MGTRRGTNLPRMGDFNQSVILEGIRRSAAGLSRIELVDITGLSAQTVTNITRRLLDDGVIAEAGRTINGPGKPRVTLRLVAESRFSVGVHLDPALITVVLLNLAGQVVGRRVQPTADQDPQRVVATIAQTIDAVLDESGIDRGLVAGVGVAVPGPLDAEKGTVIDPPKLMGWHRVPLRSALAEATGLSVTIEKDTTAAAVGDLWTSRSKAGGSFVFIYLGTGIGSALVRDGEVVTGSSHNFGEIGHIMVDPDGPDCACGGRGCVEVMCTPRAIVEQAVAAGVFDGDGEASDGPHAEDMDSRLTRLCERASAGEAGAARVLRRSAGYFAVLISVLTNVLDVDRVVLGGPFWDRLSDVYLREIPGPLRLRNATRSVREIPVEGTVVGEDGGAVGAACVVLDAMLTPRASDLYLDD